MIRYRVDKLLRARGWTRYRLAREMGTTMPAIYRLAAPVRAVTRIDARTLEKLCNVLGVGVADVLELVPEREEKRKRGR